MSARALTGFNASRVKALNLDYFTIYCIKVKNLIRGLHHGQVTVKNLEESIEFYKKIGLRLVSMHKQTVKQEGGLKDVKMKIAFLQAGEDKFELIEYTNPKDSKWNDLNPWNIGSQHIAFEVEDVKKLYNDHKNEIDFFSPPIDFKAEGIDATWTYFRDSNGAIIEIVEFR